jgi:Lrp/AsnC family leucine-responsive transcriptional regulator
MVPKIRFTENEKAVLKYLIGDGRMQCTEMAKRLGITSQAVGKIKGKLENEGVITGYTAKVDYKKLGIEVFAIGMFRFKSGVWDKLEDEDIRRRMHGPHLIRVYRLMEGDYTHMIIYGFRSIKEVEHYFQILQKERSQISELKKLYVLSADSVIKDSGADLLTKVINEIGSEELARPEVIKAVPRSDVTQTGFFS